MSKRPCLLRSEPEPLADLRLIYAELGQWLLRSDITITNQYTRIPQSEKGEIMVRLIGPCLSGEARGKFGSSLIFQRWHGRAYAKRYFKPRNPKSSAQNIGRARVRKAVARWQIATQETQDKWNEYAKQFNRTGYNAFMSGFAIYMRDHEETEPPIPFVPL